jgi:hypothetical protein
VASSKSFKESRLSGSFFNLKCDICGSEDIDDSRGVYVCRKCGIVLEIQKLQYDHPYNEDLIQYAKGSGRTQLGTKHERAIFSNSRYLHRLNRHNSIDHNEKIVIEQARFQISELFSRLNLSEYCSVKEMVLAKFKKIRPQIRPGVKYRNIEKLVAILTYMCLKIRNISVNPYELIEVSEINKTEFNNFILQIRRIIPEYQERKRKDYILQRISEVTKHFGLGMEFFYLCQKILYRLWQGIKNTTDDVVAGLVSSISLLCSPPEESSVSVSAICNKLSIRMSTIQTQVKKRIFERFKVKNFISLIKSSDLLKVIMEKLGLIEVEKPKEEEVSESDRVDLIMGNVTRIFNSVDCNNYYYFAVRDKVHKPLITTMQIHDYPFYIEKYDEKMQNFNESILDFDILQFYSHKGPPKENI